MEKTKLNISEGLVKETENVFSDENITNILKEIIEPKDVDTDSIKLHDELNPDLWEDEMLKPDIRKMLLKNVLSFIQFSELDEYKFDDVILTGSLANYNYSDYSDVDLHIVMDLKQIPADIEFTEKYVKLRKTIWEKSMPIKIKGYDLEMYFQHTEEPHHATGMYSVYQDKWIRKPIRKIVDINRPAIKSKAEAFAILIEEVMNLDDTEFFNEYEKMKEKIKKYRRCGLEREGEYSVENLVFKVLRNTGYIGKLFDEKRGRLTDKLSLDELVTS